MYQRSVQLLSCWFDLRTDVDAVAAWLDRTLPSATQHWPVRFRHAASAYCGHDGIDLQLDDAAPARVEDPDRAIARLDGWLHGRAFDALRGYTKLHAGCGRWLGRRFLLIGEKGAGKTTLMTRLIREGCTAEGDEMVLLHDGQATAYPRRFGIRLLTLGLVPEAGALAPHLLDRPEPAQPGGFHVLALDPGQLGVPWTIAPGRVDDLFFLTPDHGGPSAATVCPAHVMAQRVTSQSAPPADGHGAWLHDVGALVSSAAGWELTVGGLDSAVDAVRQCLARRQ